MAHELTLLILLGALGSGAAAQTVAPVTVAPLPDAPVARTATDATADQIDAFINERPTASSTPVTGATARIRRLSKAWVDDSPWSDGLYTQVAPGFGAEQAMLTPSAAPTDGPRRIHGEVSVGVGTHGLRTASAAAVIPIGQDATLGIAISSAHIGR